MAQDTITISALPSLVEALLVADYVPVTHNGVTYKFAPYSNFVKLTGNESVGGVKTFLSSPIAPTGAAGLSTTQIATAAFVQQEKQALEDMRAYRADKAYALNDPTFYNGVPYKSLAAGNIANTPNASPTYWEVTGGGAGSESNVGYNFTNGQFESATTGWARYLDAAGIIPVDGTGGSPNASTTFLRNATTPINGVADAILSKDDENRQGEGVSYDFTIDRGQTTSPAQITFTYKTPVAYQDGYLGVFLYDKTNGALIRMSVENIPATYGSISQFLTTFIPSTSLEYRLIFHVITDTTTQWTFEVDNIQVGQKNVAVGAAIGNWIDFPVVIANTGTLAASNAQYRRVGSNMEVRGYLQKNGTAETVPGYVNVLFPTGFSLSPYSANLENGTWSKSVNTTASTIASGPCLITAGGVLFRWLNLSNGVTGALSGTQLEANQLISFSFSAPIAQWTSNVNMASDFTEYASNDGSGGVAANTSYTTGMVNGTEGSPILALNSTTNSGYSRTCYQITFTRPIQPTDILILETNLNGRWAPISSGAAQVMLLFTQGSASYGMGLGPQIDSRSLYVEFGNAGRTNEGSTYSSPGGTWVYLTGFGVRWRVRKVSNGNMAEQPTEVYINKSTTPVLAGVGAGIVESNWSGSIRYIKYGDGTMIQWGSMVIAGALATLNTYMITLPVPFIDTGFIAMASFVPSSTWTGFMFNGISNNPSTTGIHVVITGGSVQNVTAKFQAFGRWKA